MIKIRTHTILPEEFPESWASGWGEDEYGLWMSFAYKGVEQLFRWCEPGKFLMGSPEDEPERDDDETQHVVELSQGFWIADSTVTQNLWQAIMGKNPSDFKGGHRPVEKVNWEEAKNFIRKMNELKPTLKLCLPSEVQWEYACRSGSTTPFSFGEQITPEWINYDGALPYNGGLEGEDRQKTVAVKSLPPNDWGLYEMHGNVLEWCQDRFARYPQSPSGPIDLERSNDRILRGGSWARKGGYCRSAFRLHRGPLSRSDIIGFRLARGH